MLFTPARPFRTFQNKVWVSSNCAQCPAAPREPGSCLRLCQRRPQTTTTDSCNSVCVWDLFRRSCWEYSNQSQEFSSLGRSVFQKIVSSGQDCEGDDDDVMWAKCGVQQEQGLNCRFPLQLHQWGLQQRYWRFQVRAWWETRTELTKTLWHCFNFILSYVFWMRTAW